MRLRFSVGDSYAYDAHGRPTFSLVGEPSTELKNFLEGCDVMLRQQLGAHVGPAVWRRTVIQKVGASVLICFAGSRQHKMMGFRSPNRKANSCKRGNDSRCGVFAQSCDRTIPCID